MLMLQTMFMYKTVSRKSVRYHTLTLPNRSVQTGALPGSKCKNLPQDKDRAGEGCAAKGLHYGLSHRRQSGTLAGTGSSPDPPDNTTTSKAEVLFPTSLYSNRPTIVYQYFFVLQKIFYFSNSWFAGTKFRLKCKL